MIKKGRPCEWIASGVILAKISGRPVPYPRRRLPTRKGQITLRERFNKQWFHQKILIMTKNKNNTSVWNTRIKKSSSLFQKVGSSISFDKRLFKEDIQASIAHVEMLFKKKIITFKVKNKIIFGLNRICLLYTSPSTRDQRG